MENKAKRGLLMMTHSLSGLFVWSGVFAALSVILLIILQRDLHLYVQLVEEGAATERLSAIFYLVAGVLVLLAARRLWRSERVAWRVVPAVLLGLFFIFVGGEEESWGQWIFGFEASEQLQAVNLQNETNIHNLELFSLLDPHRILLLSMLFIGVFVPLVYRFHRGGRRVLNRIAFPVCPLALSGSFLLAMAYEKVAMAMHSHWAHAEAMEFLFSLAILLYGICVFRGDHRLPDRQPGA